MGLEAWPQSTVVLSLKAAFGLGDAELTLDLGPLRDLLSECG
jgi:hypothetical protein